jgi:hypothetical protein
MEASRKSMFSAEASRDPAKTYPSPAAEQESKESGRVFGSSSLGSLGNYDPDTRSLKTCQRSLLGDSTESLETLPRAGSMRNGTIYQLVPLAPLTGGTESGLLPTPAAQPAGWQNIEVVDRDGNPPTHANQRWYDKQTGRIVQKDLRHVIERGMWPTPRASKGEHGTYKRTPSQEAGTHGLYLQSEVCEAEVEEGRTRGQLNPTWVEWLMGFPLGHTETE